MLTWGASGLESAFSAYARSNARPVSNSSCRSRQHQQTDHCIHSRGASRPGRGQGPDAAAARRHAREVRNGGRQRRRRKPVALLALGWRGASPLHRRRGRRHPRLDDLELLPDRALGLSRDRRPTARSAVVVVSRGQQLDLAAARSPAGPVDVGPRGQLSRLELLDAGGRGRLAHRPVLAR